MTARGGGPSGRRAVKGVVGLLPPPLHLHLRPNRGSRAARPVVVTVEEVGVGVVLQGEKVHSEVAGVGSD